MELPGGIDTSALLQESSTDPAVNVAFVAGEGFFSDRDGQGKNCMRMSFGNTPEDLIEEGVRRLGGLICSKLTVEQRPGPGVQRQGGSLFTALVRSGRSCP